MKKSLTCCKNTHPGFLCHKTLVLRLKREQFYSSSVQKAGLNEKWQKIAHTHICHVQSHDWSDTGAT